VGEREEAMTRRAVLLVGAMALSLVVIGGVALAASVSCVAGAPSCNGTSEDDIIGGTVSSDTINALGGSDVVDA
jgi:hypothetical protein